jgi:membrane associated rhomboid family serine protease
LVSSSSVSGIPRALAVLIALNAAAYAWTAHAADPDRLVSAFALIPFDLWHGVVLAPPAPPSAAFTLVTAMFLHAGSAHLAANLLVLVVFGVPAERLFGSVRFAALYLTCGIAGFLTEAACIPASHVPSLGASGAISGILGALAVRAPLLRLFGFVPALLVILAWVSLQVGLVLRGAQHDMTWIGIAAAESAAGTAYFAHIGGFCAGALLVGVFARERTVAR